MNSTRKRVVGLVASACLIGGWGCGDSKPAVSATRNEVNVKGIVTVKGKPVSAGDVVFDPSNFQRAEAPRTAPIGKDGTYTIKTLSGDNQVTIRGPEVDKNSELQFARERFDVKDGDTIDVKFLEGK